MAGAPPPANREAFEALFPKLVDDVSDHIKRYNLPQNVLEWFRTNMKHNTAGGKLNRGLSVLDTATILLNRPLTTTEYTQLATLGWLTELLQAYFLVADDIMDASHTRRGQPCWYKMPDVGMIAINDSFMLRSAINVLLKKHFKSHPRYIDIKELFDEVTLQTEVGQLCDLLTAPEDVVDLSQFSMDKQRFIVKYKTAFYSFYLPVALALYYLDKSEDGKVEYASDGNLKQSEDILIPLGVYFQCQDDYLDVHVDPETLGKVGTDIMDNKCSWVINEALAHANDAQKKILNENYGRKDLAKEAACKKVFAEIGIPALYTKYEDDAVAEIRKDIANVKEGTGLKPQVFEAFLNKIYKRQK